MCLEPPPSTRTVRPGPGWRHSLGSSWSDADTPVGKRPPAPQDSGSSPFSQPPCSTALLQTGAPSAACPEHPIIPTSEEPALHLHRHVQIIEQTSHSDIMAASALFNCHVMFNNKYVQQSSAYCQLFSSSTLLPVLVLLLLLKLHPHIVFTRSWYITATNRCGVWIVDTLILSVIGTGVHTSDTADGGSELLQSHSYTASACVGKLKATVYRL